MIDKSSKEYKAAYKKAWILKNKEHVLLYQKRWIENNKQHLIDYEKEYYAKNRERILASTKKYYASPKGKQYLKEYALKNKDKQKARSDRYRFSSKGQAAYARLAVAPNRKDTHKKYRSSMKGKTTHAKYIQENQYKLNVFSAKRRVIKKQAIPLWANHKYIELWYKFAKIEEKRTGKKVHVDHIVPLKSALVCGLHTEDNMQLLFAKANLVKKNCHWPNMP